MQSDKMRTRVVVGWEVRKCQAEKGHRCLMPRGSDHLDRKNAIDRASAQMHSYWDNHTLDKDCAFLKKYGVWNREGVEKFTHPRHGFENSESRTHDRMSASGIFSTWAKLFLRCIRIYINRSLSHLTKASVSTSDAQAALKALNSLQSLKWQKPKRFNNVSSHVR